MEHDPELDLTPVSWAFFSALLVFLCGFAAMNIFWIAGEWDPNLRGFYSFPSATIGDALVLPPLMYVLIRIGRWHVKKTLKRQVLLWSLGVFGIAVGVVLQWQWLLDQDIVLNWTIPAPGKFNAAGWYHAAFLCLAVGAFIVAAVQAAISSYYFLGTRPKNIGLEYSLALILLPLFPALQAIDFARPSDPILLTLSKLLPILLIPLAIAMILVPFLGLRSLPVTLSACLLALAIPLSLVYFSTMDWDSRIALLLISLWASNFALPTWGNASTPVSLITGLSMTALALNIGIWLSTVHVDLSVSIWQHSWLTICATTLLLLLLRMTGNTRCTARVLISEHLINIAIFTASATLGIWAAVTFTSPQLDAFFVLWTISIAGVIQVVAHLFKQAIEAEDSGSRRRVAEYKIRSYAWGFTAGLVIIATLVRSEASSFGGTVMTIDTQISEAMDQFGMLALTCWLVWILACRVATRLRSSNIHWLVFVLGAVTVSTACAMVLATSWKYLSAIPSLFPVPVVAVLPTLAVFCMVYISVRNNVFVLRGKRPSIRNKAEAAVIAAITAILALAAMAILLSGRMQLRGWIIGSLLLLAAVLTSGLVVPALRLKNGDDLSRFSVKSSPKSGMVQDSALIILMFIFVAGYPVFSLLHHESLTTSAVRVIAFLGAVASIYGWIINNNIEHAEKYHPRHDKYLPPTENESLMDPLTLHRLITRHVIQQNLISVLMIVLVIPHLLVTLDLNQFTDKWFGLRKN